MEMGSTFRSQPPKFRTDDPSYRIVRRVPSHLPHYYFYVRDPVIGPLAMCVGAYLSFQRTNYLIEIELRRQGVTSPRRQYVSLRGPEGAASARRLTERLHHRETVELLELASGAQVF